MEEMDGWTTRVTTTTSETKRTKSAPTTDRCTLLPCHGQTKERKGNGSSRVGGRSHVGGITLQRSSQENGTREGVRCVHTFVRETPERHRVTGGKEGTDDH